MRLFTNKSVLFLIVTGALSAQSIVEMGAITAGSTVGGVAGKSISDSINTSLRKTGGVVEKASKADPKSQVPVPPAAKGPAFEVSPGVPQAPAPSRRSAAVELNNVPPPPPPTRRVATRPAPPRPQPIPAFVEPAPEPAPRVDIDLGSVTPGMPRPELLALGDPSARITMFEDGHLVEVFSYRNNLLASGSVRLIDGSVATIQTRP